MKSEGKKKANKVPTKLMLAWNSRSVSMAISVVPVSYTHLDVYKRQGYRYLTHLMLLRPLRLDMER